MKGEILVNRLDYDIKNVENEAIVFPRECQYILGAAPVQGL